MGYIYMIRNTVNGKAYIGQTINKIERRINEHFNYTQVGSRLLKQAVHKYGRDAFTIEILHEALDIFLDDLEVAAIEKHNTLSPNGYNLTTGGESNKYYSQETRRKMSEAHKRRKYKPHAPETRRKISEANKGKRRTPEQCRKNSEARKGKPLSPEHCRNLAHPDRSTAFEILNSLPECMPLKEKRKILFNKFPGRPIYTIYKWVRKWSETS